MVGRHIPAVGGVRADPVAVAATDAMGREFSGGRPE